MSSRAECVASTPPFKANSTDWGSRTRTAMPGLTIFKSPTVCETISLGARNASEIKMGAFAISRFLGVQLPSVVQLCRPSFERSPGNSPASARYLLHAIRKGEHHPRSASGTVRDRSLYERIACPHLKASMMNRHE
jgi:hypothetical protein